MEKKETQITKEAYEVLKRAALEGESLYDCYKRPSLRKMHIWEYYKFKFKERCSVYSHNCCFFSIIALDEDDNIVIVHPTRTVFLGKAE